MVDVARALGVALPFRVPSEAHRLLVNGRERQWRNVPRLYLLSNGGALHWTATELLEQVGVEISVIHPGAVSSTSTRNCATLGDVRAAKESAETAEATESVVARRLRQGAHEAGSVGVDLGRGGTRMQSAKLEYLMPKQERGGHDGFPTFLALDVLPDLIGVRKGDGIGGLGLFSPILRRLRG